MVSCGMLHRMALVLLVAASVVPTSPILVTLMKEVLGPPKRRFLQEPHGVTSEKTPFFILDVVQCLRYI
jgi:hypothetical protein